jgi:hypothetical protein
MMVGVSGGRGGVVANPISESAAVPAGRRRVAVFLI